MGRRKALSELSFPALPVPFVDAMLYAESDIRRAIKEARAAVSFIGARDILAGVGKRGRKTDKTAAAAQELSEELPAIVLDDGRTVKRPEAWGRVFDAVRMRAKQCKRPEWVFDVWRTTYKGQQFFTARGIGPETARRVKSWIRCSVLFDARAAGLVSFSDEEIMDGISAAEFEHLDA